MEFLEKYTAFVFLLSVVIATWIILYYFISETTKKQRLLISLTCGIVLGSIWYIFLKTPIDQLILGILAAAGFYDYIIGQIMEKTGVKYNNNKGIEPK